jgi:molecular chaperone DnaK
LKGDNKEAIESKSQALMAASQKLGEKMYAGTQAPGGESAQAGAQSAEPDKKPADDVVDADYREVKRG